MEIIAQKFQRKNTFIAILMSSITLLLTGGALLIISIFFMMDSEVYVFIAAFFMAAGLLCTVLSAIGTVRYYRLPQTLITYENGVFTLPKGEKIQAHTVTDLNYTVAQPGYKNFSVNMGFGSVSFVSEGKKYKINYTAETARVYSRIKELAAEAKLLK